MPLQDLMKSTVDIQRPNVSPGQSMEQSRGYSTVAAACPARVCPYDPATGGIRKMNQFDQKIGEVTHRVFFYPVQDVRIEDQLVVSGGNYGVGDVYEVIGSFVPDQLDIYQVCLARRVVTTS